MDIAGIVETVDLIEPIVKSIIDNVDIVKIEDNLIKIKKEKRVIQNKNYYEKNSDNVRYVKSIKCECGQDVSKNSLKRHLLSNRHIKAITGMDEPNKVIDSGVIEDIKKEHEELNRNYGA